MSHTLPLLKLSISRQPPFPFLSSVQTFVLYHTPVYGIFASKIWFFYFVQIFLTPQTRLFPGFFRSFSIFRKKNKKSACILLQSKIY